ncbi:hypothetical protein O181_037444 [Austropuccinia psidii MF-1]|uniref:Secreted protein n=1 Tax=Austropuccinia psidii MF-1 TaxID=1389203 RepID=A0A9Q3D6J3_9BASI|nr:hypothetical protein [Austropuccinia psidii MF-1]
MLITKVTIVLAFCLSTAIATNHTMCYRYFKLKDKCIQSAADDRHRCGARVTNVKIFKSPQKTKSKKPQKNSKGKKPNGLARRYTTTEKSDFIPTGKGICPQTYDTDNFDGVCIWSGMGDGSVQTSAGWLNGVKTSNCNKTVYVQRPGPNAKPVYARVVDGCGFNTENSRIGCFQIYLTKSVFTKLNATPEEWANGHMDKLIWNFANEDGQSPSNGPV